MGTLDREEVQRMIDYVYLEKVAPQLAQVRNDMVRFAGDGNGRRGELQHMEGRVNEKFESIISDMKAVKGDVLEVKTSVGNISSKMDKVAIDKAAESATWTIRKKVVWGVCGSMSLVVAELLVKWLASQFFNIH